MGHKHVAEILKTGRAISYNLEACLKEGNFEKARAIADPDKIDKAYHIVTEGAERRIQAEEKVNWYLWAKPRGQRTSADLGAENAFKEFYKGESLSEEEKKVLLGSLAIKIEEELKTLTKERNTIRM